jgi:hypothetical protein
VRCFDGLLTGKIDALIGSFGSFAGEPEVRHPVRGRAKGASAFAQLVTDTTTWMAERTVPVEDVSVIITPPRGVDDCA